MAEEYPGGKEGRKAPTAGLNASEVSLLGDEDMERWKVARGGESRRVGGDEDMVTLEYEGWATRTENRLSRVWEDIEDKCRV